MRNIECSQLPGHRRGIPVFIQTAVCLTAALLMLAFFAFMGAAQAEHKNTTLVSDSAQLADVMNLQQQAQSSFSFYLAWLDFGDQSTLPDTLTSWPDGKSVQIELKRRYELYYESHVDSGFSLKCTGTKSNGTVSWTVNEATGLNSPQISMVIIPEFDEPGYIITLGFTPAPGVSNAYQYQYYVSEVSQYIADYNVQYGYFSGDSFAITSGMTCATDAAPGGAIILTAKYRAVQLFVEWYDEEGTTPVEWPVDEQGNKLQTELAVSGSDSAGQQGQPKTYRLFAATSDGTRYSVNQQQDNRYSVTLYEVPDYATYYVTETAPDGYEVSFCDSDGNVIQLSETVPGIPGGGTIRNRKAAQSQGGGGDGEGSGGEQDPSQGDGNGNGDGGSGTGGNNTGDNSGNNDGQQGGSSESDGNSGSDSSASNGNSPGASGEVQFPPTVNPVQPESKNLPAPAQQNGQPGSTGEPATPETVTLTVRNRWDDAGNRDGIRPPRLYVDLMEGNQVLLTVSLHSGNGWSAEIEDLPRFRNGQEIAYTWVQNGAPKGYQLAGIVVDGSATTLTNRHVPVTPKEPGVRTLTVKLIRGSETVDTLIYRYMEGDEYSISLPEITGYEPKQKILTGRIVRNMTLNVRYLPVIYTLKIRYIYPNGREAAPSREMKMRMGYPYDVVSPVMKGCWISQPRVRGKMPARDAEISVFYCPEAKTLAEEDEFLNVREPLTRAVLDAGLGEYETPRDENWSLETLTHTEPSQDLLQSGLLPANSPLLEMLSGQDAEPEPDNLPATSPLMTLLSRQNTNQNPETLPGNSPLRDLMKGDREEEAPQQPADQMPSRDFSLIEQDPEGETCRANRLAVSGAMVTEDGEGNRSYLFSLYRDMKYPDGTTVTAWDYAYSVLCRVLSEDSRTDCSWILGYDEYISGETRALSGLRVAGEYELLITVRHEAVSGSFSLSCLDFIPERIGEYASGNRVYDRGAGAYIGSAEQEE